MIESEFKSKPSGFTLIGKGSNYDVHRFNVDDKPYVLRFQQRATYDFSPVESKLLTQLNGEFAPKLFIYDSGNLAGSPFMVQSFVEGEHITDLNIGQLKIVKDSISKVHEKTKRKIPSRIIKEYFFEFYCEKFCNGIIQNISVEKNVKDQVYHLAGKYLESFDAMKPVVIESECLIHGDLNHTNLLWKNNAVCFIDWELARYSIPSFEYAIIAYGHGKSKELYQGILDLFNNDEKKIIQTGFYLKLLDALSWRLKYMHQIILSKDEFEQQLLYLSRDLEKINYPD
jgi:Ser/Thr protein kinase RdoA (MazF antagonist)